MERAAAQCCHIFSTVSEVTGDEAEHLPKRKPGELRSDLKKLVLLLKVVLLRQ